MKPIDLITNPVYSDKFILSQSIPFIKNKIETNRLVDSMERKHIYLGIDDKDKLKRKIEKMFSLKLTRIHLENEFCYSDEYMNRYFFKGDRCLIDSLKKDSFFAIIRKLKNCNFSLIGERQFIQIMLN